MSAAIETIVILAGLAIALRGCAKNIGMLWRDGAKKGKAELWAAMAPNTRIVMIGAVMVCGTVLIGSAS